MLTEINYIINEMSMLFSDDFSGHDYWHSLRVYKNAVKIAEDIECDKDIVAIVALLHDVDDEKLFESSNYHNARKIMKNAGISNELIEHIIAIISEISYRGIDSVVPKTIEGKIVQDADRLDALGAIGIARTFAYGGSRGREIYNPDVEPQKNIDSILYLESNGSSVNHFYEKLFKLKDMMNTDVGKQIAEERDRYMQEYLKRFFDEWEGL